MRELTVGEVRELWVYREQWMGIVTATDSATPLDIVGWVLEHVEGDNLTAALAFFERAVHGGVVAGVFSEVASPQWQRSVELILMEMRRRDGRLDPSSVRESLSPQETLFIGMFNIH